MKVLPGREWSLHYPVDPATRSERLRGLLEGKYTSDEVAAAIKPDALFYDTEDIQTEGLEKVSSRIRDLSAFITHYDYPRFARFVKDMQGHDIPLEDLDNLYSDITQARVQKKVMDSYGYTGRKQLEGALREEVGATISNIRNLPRSEKVLRALKINWMNEDLGLVTTEERDRIVSELSGDERQLFNDLAESYRDYIQKGDEGGYQKLTDTVRKDFPKIKGGAKSDKPSESMQQLEKELEQFKEKVVPPGAPEDPAIPPEDQDEYHTPPPSPGESKEGVPTKPIFEISPALSGYYASGRKSYYDVDSKTWSKKKQLSSYNVDVEGSELFEISGVFDGGLKSLPIPSGYALKVSSLKYKGNQPSISRDQNGCFYFQTSGPGTFSIDFQKEVAQFESTPIPEDTAQLYRGILSQKTETAILRFMGTPIQKAEQARQHILANHFYPGGGDLQQAQALQYKLRSESTGENYLQNIDISEYLECYSANTKFIAMMRKAGIPARLVTGHRVEGSKNKKSAITQNTGHAWSEIWDGKAWRRFDATPGAKPEDKKGGAKNEASEDGPPKEAEDGGIEKPQEKGSKDGQGKPDEKNEESSSTPPKNPLEQMGEASDRDAEESESQLEQAKTEMAGMEKKKEELEKKVSEAAGFKDLSELQKEVGESELFDDTKKELQDKLDAKEDQMKDGIKEGLDKMVADGFMDEKKREEILREMEQKKTAELDSLQKEVEQENRLYNEYESMREEITPLVDRWFEYFAERLPRQKDISFDEDSLTRQGSFDRRAVMKSRNLLFGTVKNPREIISSIKPRFMASILVDVSGSMQGPKLKNAQKLLIFYSELFSKISQAFGYIRFSIDTFSDSITEIKKFDQDYDSPQRYAFDDGSQTTVKVRLMQKLVTKGGTNMLDGIKKAAQELNEQAEDYPDHASAFYFVGDGGDTYGNSSNITNFLQINETERGFGEHMYSAILLGGESQRQELAAIFGDDHTNVAPNFDELIERSMEKFDDDLEEYLKTKVR